MSNFEYIIASLPFLTADYRYRDGSGFDAVIAELRENLSEKDGETLDFLLKGLRSGELDRDFYAEALSPPCRFIREYFRFDLNLRNAKVRYLNSALGRPEGMDILSGAGNDDDTDLDIDLQKFTPGEFEEESATEAVLSGEDLIEREKGLDDLVWEKADALSTFHYFDLTAVLAYVSKLAVVDRWLALDQQAGRERFRKLVEEVRGTFKGVRFNDNQ